MRRPRVVAGIVAIAGVLAACSAPDDDAPGGASAVPVGEPRPSGLLPGATALCDTGADDNRAAPSRTPIYAPVHGPAPALRPSRAARYWSAREQAAQAEVELAVDQ